MNKQCYVIARIFGGLGNQLFCYAAARQLAVVNNVPLVLDTRSGFTQDNYGREYLLDRFAIDCEEIGDWDSFMHFGGRIRRRLVVVMNRVLPFGERWYIKEEKPHHFDPRLLNVKVMRLVYLDGYWQSEKYFSDIEDILRDDLVFRMPHSLPSRKMATTIEKTEAVSVHMRSFSGVPDPTTSSIWHRPLSLEYYMNAVQRMMTMLDNPVFYCFSDNLNWARTRFPKGLPVNYVDVNMGRGCDGAVDDLWLMSHCKHHILSNSTFSWWGAWLGRRESSQMIVPSNLSSVSLGYFPSSYISL